MERKKFLKEILEICKDGKFNKALKLIKNSHGKIDNKCAVSIIISCCNVCVNNTSSPENILEDDLYELLKFVISRIENVYESELLSYLQSIYFILKTLGVKKRYDVIVKMQSMLVPSFLLPNLSPKHKITFQSCAGLLHNLVITSGTENSKCNGDIIGICYIVSNIHGKLSNPSSLLSISYNCGSTLCCLGISTKVQEEYFFYVLDLLKKEELKSISNENFKCLVKHFTLIYNIFFQKADFESAANFYKKAFVCATEVFQGEINSHILTLLMFPLILSPAAISNKKMESFIDCKGSLQQLNSSCSELLENKLMNTLVYTIVSYYKGKNSQTWTEFPQTFQLDLLHFIYDVGQFEAHRQFLCPCNCLVKKNIHQLFSYLQYIYTLLEITVRLQTKVAPSYHEKCSNLLIKFCPQIQTLKDCNCEKWKSAWNILGTGMYNIGAHLYQKSIRESLSYFCKLVKYFIKFEGKTGKTLKFSLVSSAFTAICSLNANDSKSCMAYTALAMVFCQNQREYLMSHWIKAKVGQRDLKTPDSEEVQRITLVSAFDKLQAQMALLTDEPFILSEADKVDLLIFELEQYKKKWKSKVPMMSALRELYDTADLNTTVQAVVKVFGDCDLIVHDEVPKLIHRILRQYEAKVNKDENQDLESTILLAVLYHLYYKYSVKDTIIKNTNDMERTMIMVQKTSEPPDAIPRDPNGECDIVSSYECLKLDRYFCVMKYLNKSLSLFASVINDSLDPSSLEPVMVLTVYNLLLKIFFEYRLHNHRVRGLQALHVALKLAQLENKPANIIQTIGFIIENSDVTRSYVKCLILLADKQVANVPCTDLTNLKIILTYYICKAKGYLYRDYKEAYRIFQRAKDLYEVQDDKSELLIFKCQLLLLDYKFVMLPCKLEIVDHQKNTLLTIHTANQAIYEVYNTSKLDGSYEMSILLDANEELTKLYHSLRAPREVRAYCRETIILTQKLVLPLRCASYLVYLAHADLRSSRFDDCQIKLNGLADILSLYVNLNFPVDQENEPPTVMKLEKEIDGITNDMQEMVLDLPISNSYKKQLCPSSPTLIIEPFHLPGFIRHADYCDCFYCICFEYQVLVLQKSRLDALLNVKENNAVIATDFFRGALSLYERCCSKRKSYTKNVAKLISYDLIPDLEKELLEPHACILLDYSYHVKRTKTIAEALDMTNKLIQLVSSRKLDQPHLYNEALIQKLGYLMQRSRVTMQINGAQLDAETSAESDLGILCAPQTDCFSTTPESKQSKVTVTLESTPNITPMKRVVKKCLPFDLSPSEENESNQISKKNPPTFKNFPKTPAPKIKIYTNDDPDMAKAKTPAMNVKVHAASIRKRTNKKQNLANIAFVASETTSTPAVTCLANAENGLKSRTKLLTERLRQTSKATEVTVAPAPKSVNDEVMVLNGKKMSVRKNLLSELTYATQQTESHGGAIRKSARNKK